MGGWVEDLARGGGAAAVAVGLLAAAVKMAGAILALAWFIPPADYSRSARSRR